MRSIKILSDGLRYLLSILLVGISCTWAYECKNIRTGACHYKRMCLRPRQLEINSLPNSSITCVCCGILISIILGSLVKRTQIIHEHANICLIVRVGLREVGPVPLLYLHPVLIPETNPRHKVKCSSRRF